MDLNFFENDIFCQIFNINLNEIVWIKFLRLFKIFSKTFQKYTKNTLGIFPQK
jgi:hypothetical protein